MEALFFLVKTRWKIRKHIMEWPYQIWRPSDERWNSHGQKTTTFYILHILYIFQWGLLQRWLGSFWPKPHGKIGNILWNGHTKFEGPAINAGIFTAKNNHILYIIHFTHFTVMRVLSKVAGFFLAETTWKNWEHIMEWAYQVWRASDERWNFHGQKTKPYKVFSCIIRVPYYVWNPIVIVSRLEGTLLPGTSVWGGQTVEPIATPLGQVFELVALDVREQELHLGGALILR